MSRRKRIKEGLAAVKKQIELHKIKLENAVREGKAELMDYYEKEIESLERDVYRREKTLVKKRRKKQ